MPANSALEGPNATRNVVRVGLLDSESADELRRLVPVLVDRGKTMLLTTHYMFEGDRGFPDREVEAIGAAVLGR